MGHTEKEQSTRSPQDDTARSMPQRSDGAIGIQLADMAWRVATPLLGFSLLGIWFDAKQDTDPLFSLIGIALGIAVTVLVMKRFLEQYYPETLNQIMGRDTERTSAKRGAKK